MKQNVLMINNQEECKSTDINGFHYVGLQRYVGQEDFAVGKNTSHLHAMYLYTQHSSVVENKNLYYSPINIHLHLQHNFQKELFILKVAHHKTFPYKPYSNK